MEGNDSTQGTIRRATLPRTRIAPPSATIALDDVAEVTPGPGNRRDPEVAFFGGHGYLVWSDFTKAKNGTVQLQELDCP